jgi:hypothetical protein
MTGMTSEERLAAIEAKLDTVIRLKHIDDRLIDGFDDRIAHIEAIGKQQAELSRRLSEAAMRLTIARIMSKGAILQVIASTVLAVALAGYVANTVAHDAVAHAHVR